jgi:hypothetical protein
MAVLEAQVGHMSTQMVRWYTHVSSRAQHEAARRIEAANPELLTALGFRAQRVGDVGVSHFREGERLVVLANDSASA